jgi:ABC-2 type transport system permease protein
MYAEGSYRVAEGVYAVIAFIILIPFFSTSLQFTNGFVEILLATVIAILAFLLSFTFKMIVGLISFWTTDIGGLYQVTDIVIITLAGYIMPIMLMPDWIQNIALTLPFSYMIYFPIAAFSSQLTALQELRVIVIQLCWIIGLSFIYKQMWKAGVKNFTAVGQ